MIRYIAKYSLLAVLCFGVLPCHAQQDTVQQVVTKAMTKVFNNLSGEELAITNQYGDINIKPWHNPQVRATITITAQSATKAGAEKLLNRIDILQQRNDTSIALQTKIKLKDASGKLPPPEGKCNITYDIFMPENTWLNLKNRFGNINMGSHNGRLIIDENFGNLTGGNLNGNSIIHLSLGSIKAASLDNASISAKGFDSIRIDTIAGNVDCGLSAGKLLDIGFINGNYNFVLKSDNIQVVNFHLPPSFNAEITAHCILSTVVNKSHFGLNTLQLPQTGAKDSTVSAPKDSIPPKQLTGEVKQLDKKILELRLLKKTVEYRGKTGEGAVNIRLAVYFSKLTFQ